MENPCVYWWFLSAVIWEEKTQMRKCHIRVNQLMHRSVGNFLTINFVEWPSSPWMAKWHQWTGVPECVCQCSVAMKRHHYHNNSYKEKTYLELAYRFQVLDHYCHCKKHGGMKKDMVFESRWVFYIQICRYKGKNR